MIAIKATKAVIHDMAIVTNYTIIRIAYCPSVATLIAGSVAQISVKLLIDISQPDCIICRITIRVVVIKSKAVLIYGGSMICRIAYG